MKGPDEKPSCPSGLYIYIFISPQMVDNKQYEKKNKNKQK